MRIVAKFKDIEKAEQFSAFLKNEGITNSIDFNFNIDTEQTESAIWVHNEDQIDIAQKHYQEYSKNPLDPIFKTQPSEIPPQEDDGSPKQTLVRKDPDKKAVTMLFILLCVFFYSISFLQSYQILKEKKETQSYVVTPIQLAFLYDVPRNIELAKKYLEEEGESIGSELDNLSIIQKTTIARILQTPSWKGYYPFLLPKEKREGNLLTYPPFNKIRQGEVWRAFTPCLLHGNLIHILFNMLWFWLLGRQVEKRLSFIKSIFLILLIGIVSNTAQYLVSGFNFLGFSGVVTGLAGFIWSRQKVAPWEGHLIQPSVFIFLGFYIVALLFYQVLGYFVELFTNTTFPGSIANTAHIVGALAGIVLGRLSFFSWRPRER